MPTVIKGSRVLTLIQLTVLELEAEANALLDRAIIEKTKLMAFEDLSEEEANKRIKDQIVTGTEFAKAWNNRIDSIIQEMGKQLVAEPVRNMAQQNPTQLFDWMLGSVKTHHCPDCLRLSGMEARTVSGWESLGYGLPRDGETICNVGCHCLLSPVSP